MSKRKKNKKRTPQQKNRRKKLRERRQRAKRNARLRIENQKLELLKIEKERYSKLTDIEKEVIDYTNVETDFFDKVKEEMGNPIRRIKYIKDEETEFMKCHKNATHLSNKIDGKRVKGWRVYLPNTNCKELFNGMKVDMKLVKANKRYGVVELQQHMVVEGQDGILYDNSPTEGVGVSDKVGFFIQDDRLLTEASSSKGRSVSHIPIEDRKMKGLDMGDYMWGNNMIYVSKSGSGYMKTKYSHDIKHLSPGELGFVKTYQPTGSDMTNPHIKTFIENFGKNKMKVFIHELAA